MLSVPPLPPTRYVSWTLHILLLSQLSNHFPRALKQLLIKQPNVSRFSFILLLVALSFHRWNKLVSPNWKCKTSEKDSPPNRFCFHISGDFFNTCITVYRPLAVRGRESRSQIGLSVFQMGQSSKESSICSWSSCSVGTLMWIKDRLRVVWL